MKSRINELTQLRADALKNARTISNSAMDEGRVELSADELENYNGFMSKIDDLDAQIVAEQRVLDAERGVKAIDTGIETGDDGADKFQSIGEQMIAVAAQTMGEGSDPRLIKAAATGMNEGAGADGGFLVQTDFASELFRLAHTGGEILSRVRKLPIGPNANGLTMNAIAESSRAAGSRWGGVRAHWAAEADTVTDSRPKFRQIELDLNKLMALLYATDELLADATALGGLINEVVPEEITFNVEDSIVNGDGVGKPLGMLSSGALVTQAIESGQTIANTSTHIAANVAEMWSRLHVRSKPNSVWMVQPELTPKFQGAKIGDRPVFMPPQGLADAPFGILYGRPVLETEFQAAEGTVGDFMLADLRNYLTIDKGGIEAAQSMHVRFLQGEQVFRFTYRVDGQPIENAPLTPYKGSDTKSSFVALAARS